METALCTFAHKKRKKKKKKYRQHWRLSEFSLVRASESVQICRYYFFFLRTLNTNLVYTNLIRNTYILYEFVSCMKMVLPLFSHSYTSKKERMKGVWKQKWMESEKEKKKSAFMALHEYLCSYDRAKVFT